MASALSPLVQSYNDWNFNRPYGNALPRPADQFTTGAFGPLTPIMPVGIDQPQESGRPDPRRSQYPVGWNLPVGQPGSEGIKLTTFANLRALADMFSVARDCVDFCIQEIVGLPWEIVPTTEASEAMADDDDARSDWEKRAAEVKEFFEHPDSDRAKYPTFSAWLTALLEDMFVLDAVAVHMRPSKIKGKGLLGSDLAKLDLLDGTTIRPLLDLSGATPTVPNVAYQQYVWGVPRVDMMSIITDADIDALAEPVDEFRSDQLLYLRYHPRNWTPYGFGPIEKSLLPISIGLARQQYQWDFYQDGSIPGQFVVPGPDISTPQQIRQLQDALNALAGDIGAKHRIVVLPPGSKTEAQKPPPLADQFDEWITAQVTMGFGMTPMDLGVTPRVSAIQSPAEGKQMSQMNNDKGSENRREPRLTFLKTVLFDYVIQKIARQEDMEWSWGLTKKGESRDDQVQLVIQEIGVGLKSIDEGRVALGDKPWGLPETSVPLWNTATGPVPLQAVSMDSDPAIAAAPGAPALPPGQSTPAGQQQADQPTDDELTTPSHEASQDAEDTNTSADKAVKVELEILGRYLRKGRPLEDFHSTVLTVEDLVAAGDALPKGVPAAVSAAASAILRRATRTRREDSLAAVMRQVATSLGQLVRGFRSGNVATLGFVDTGVDVLLEGYRRAVAAGSAHAHDDHPNTPQLLLAGDAEIRAEKQRGFLMRLLTAILGTQDTDKLANRLKLYSDSLRPAYNEAYGKTVESAHPDYEIVWVLGDTEHCELCLGRADQSFTFETLPGWPGDGGFGGPLCEGGQLCGCHLEYRVAGKTVAEFHNIQRDQAKDYYAEQLARITQAREEAAERRQEFVDSLPDETPVGGGASTRGRAQTRDDLRRELADLANARIRAEGGYPGVSVEPYDIPAKIIAQLLPPEERGGLKDLPQIDIDQAIELLFAHKGLDIQVAKVGPKGYIHGWIFVGVPGVGADVFHPHHGHGTVTHAEHGTVSVRFDSGHEHSFETREHPEGPHGTSHFEPRDPHALPAPARPSHRELAAMSDDELARSIVSDDDQHVANVLSELERRDKVAGMARRDQIRAELRDHPPATDEDRDSAYDRLVSAGADSEEAFADVYGVGSERQRRDAAISQLRSQGYSGQGFDQLARNAFNQEAQRQYFTAENATRGHMLNRTGLAAGVDPGDLFTGTEARARKYASEELLAHWQSTGRLTYENFTNALLGQAQVHPRGGYFL